MRRSITSACLIAVLLAFSLPAPAAFVLTVPEITIGDPSQSTQVNVDIFFSEVDPPTADNRLAGFAVRLDIGGDSNGLVHFPTQKPNGIALTPTDLHPYIFLQATLDDEGNPVPVRPLIPANDEAYGPHTITVAALCDVGREATIGLNQGVLRVPIIFEPGAIGLFTLTLDPLVTSFANADGLPIPATLDNGFFVYVPEPTSLGLLLTGGSTLLIRRRKPAHDKMSV